MNRLQPIALICALLMAFGAHQAHAKVGWAPVLERGPGAGYNAKHYDKRVAKPKSVLKHSRANRAVHNERRFTRKLGSQTRANMTHRGQVAKHSRSKGRVKATLNNTARSSSRQARHAKRAATSARHTQRAHRTAKIARHSSKLRTAGKVAGGGLLVAGAVYGAEQTLGVDVPDPFEAAEWSYHTIKDPKNAGRRFNKLGRDSVREVNKGWKTLNNPKKMERNIVRSANKTAKGVKKLGKKVEKLFKF